MSELQLKHLVCDYRTNLLGTDNAKPRFGWKLHSEKRGTLQTAYQIQVADSPGFGILLWDTGRVESDRSIQIEYGGAPLVSKTRYYYRVQVWDCFGRCSSWSAEAWWETALLDTGEWTASWITPHAEVAEATSPPVAMLRKDFSLQGGIASARIYATAAGLYEISLNGSRVGEEWLSPGWTSYHHRHQYQTYDVTSCLQEGGNAVGIQLADGWYTGRLGWEAKNHHFYGERRAALLELHVRYADGVTEIIATDTSWRSAEGPIRFSGLYDGETYDAGMEQPGWSRHGLR
jgi:alpha-L-rhamnosidase